MAPEWKLALATGVAAAVPLIYFLTRKARKTHEVTDNGAITLLDLEQPVLPLKFRFLNVLLGIFSRETKPTVESLMKAACENTGLDDFGNEEEFPFTEGLAQIVSDMEREFPKMTPLGRLGLVLQHTGHLEVRLRIVDAVKQHPEILQEEIKDPVFIIGPARTGTTHLHRALGSHDAFRILKHYEMKMPVITPDVEEAIKDGRDDPRRVKTATELQQALEMRPFFNCMHEITADGSEEDIQLIALTYLSIHPLITMMCTNYLKWNTERNATSGLEFLKLTMKVVQWQDVRSGGERKRFLMKSPAHMNHLPELVKVFPDAKVIETYRNPTECLTSMAYLLTYSYGINYKMLDLNAAGKFVADVLAELFQKHVDNHEHIRKRAYVLDFRAYAKDNVGFIKKILEFLGEKSDEGALESVMRYIDSRQRFSLGRIEYEPSVFGIDMKEAEEQFSSYSKYIAELEKSGS